MRDGDEGRTADIDTLSEAGTTSLTAGAVELDEVRPDDDWLRTIIEDLTEAGIAQLFVHLATQDCTGDYKAQEFRRLCLPGWTAAGEDGIGFRAILPGLTLETAALWPTIRSKGMVVEYAEGTPQRAAAIAAGRRVRFIFGLSPDRYGSVVMEIINWIRWRYDSAMAREITQ